MEIILNLWSSDFCKRLVRVFLFWSFIFILDLIVFSKLYKFSKFVMYLNSCSMDLGRDSFDDHPKMNVSHKIETRVCLWTQSSDDRS